MVRRGFTLIEMVVVLTLVALLATIATVTHKTRVRKAKEAVLKHNLSQIRLTLDAYNNDKGHYPESLDILVDQGYLREIPMDPMTQSRQTWELIYEDDVGDEDSSYEPGIFDIRSGSDEEAIDGTFYNEW